MTTGTEVRLGLSIRTLTKVTAAAIVVLVAGHAFVAVPGFPGASLFDLDQESGFGTWFNSMLLVSAGAAAAVLARVRRARGAPWLALGLFAAVLFLLGIEEVAAMHERIARALDRSSSLGTREGVSLQGLVLAPAAVVGLVLLARQLSPVGRRRVVVSVVVWWLAAFGVEQAEERAARPEDPADIRLRNERAAAGLQEALELSATGALLVALLAEMSGSTIAVQVAENPIRP
jgi:hypothetical protein